MNKNILIIVNPNAGKGKVQKKIHKIANNFSKQDYVVDIIYTKKNYSAKDIIQDYKGPLQLVICCGGDGTLNDLINAVMLLENKPKISFIPLGTMNDFANTIQLFKHRFFMRNNMKNCKTIKADIGKFNNKYFNYVCAFGAFTMVPYVTKQSLKKVFGKLAYFIVGVRYIAKIKAYNVKIDVDGKIIKDNVIYGSISNSKSIGGFQWFRKRDIDIADGKYEVVLVRNPKYKIGMIAIVFNILFKQYNNKNFLYLQGSNIKINSSINLKWTLDGESGGRQKEVIIQNNKKALEYVIPGFNI